MKIRKFVAPSVPLALRQVRDELGDGAVILDTRKLPPGADPRACVEITAAVEEAAVARTPSASAGGGRHPRVGRLDALYRQRPSASSVARPPTTPRWREEDDEPEAHARSAAQWLARLPHVAREATTTAPPVAPETTGSMPWTAPPATAARAAAADRGPVSQSAADTSGLGAGADAGGDPRVLQQLRQLEEVVHRMARKASGFELPPEVSRLGERLRRTGMVEVHVHGCLQELMRRLDRQQMDDPAAVAAAAARIVADLLPDRVDLRVGKGRKVVALAGPSGSGKTTAAAKIAAGFARRRQQRGGSPAEEIVLVSTDGRRVGALAQAQAFADLIGVATDTAYDAAELAAVVARHDQARLILIDLAGCGPHERAAVEQQTQMLAAAGVDEVHQVVDGLTGFDHICEACAAWSDVPTRRLLLSKMDQAVRPGVVVSAAIECCVPTSYLTTSAELPGGIRPGDLTPFVDWIVGRGPRPFVDSTAADAGPASRGAD